MNQPVDDPCRDRDIKTLTQAITFLRGQPIDISLGELHANLVELAERRASETDRVKSIHANIIQRN